MAKWTGYLLETAPLVPLPLSPSPCPPHLAPLPLCAFSCASRSRCSTICGDGTRSRVRYPLYPKAQAAFCQSEVLEQSNLCFQPPCVGDCVMGAWSEWTDCRFAWLLGVAAWCGCLVLLLGVDAGAALNHPLLCHPPWDHGIQRGCPVLEGGQGFVLHRQLRQGPMLLLYACSCCYVPSSQRGVWHRNPSQESECK